MEELMRLVVKYTTIPPLSLYDYTLAELNLMIEEGIKKEKNELNNLCQIIKIGNMTAQSNAPIKLFEEEEQEGIKKIDKNTRDEEIEALKRL